MIVSASSGTTSQAIFSITSRLAFDSASRNIASPPSAGGGTTLREGLWLDEGTGRRGVGAGFEGGGLDGATPGMGGRGITIVVPLPPGETAGLAVGGGADGRAGAAPGLIAAPAAGAMIGFAFGFARIVLTCSISLALSNGF